MAKIITLSKYLNEKKKTKNATATAFNLLYYDTFARFCTFLFNNNEIVKGEF